MTNANTIWRTKRPAAGRRQAWRWTWTCKWMGWLTAAAALSACGPAPQSRQVAAGSPAVAPLPAPPTLESTIELAPDVEMIEFDPRIVHSARGDTVAVWEQFDGSGFRIWGNRKMPGGSWGRAAMIDGGATGNAYNPQLVINTRGTAMAVWVQTHDAAKTCDIWSRRYDPLAGWSAPVRIESGEGPASSPQIAIDDQGNAAAVWQQSDGRRFNIWANRYTPGAGWGAATRLETGNASLGAPQVAIDAHGNVMAVWAQFSGDHTGMWANRQPAGGAWGRAGRIETARGYARSPALSSSPEGDVTVVWEQLDGHHTSLRGSITGSEKAGSTPAAGGRRAGR